MNNKKEYIEKVRKGIELYELMEKMENNEKLTIRYNNKKYRICCLIHDFKTIENRKDYIIDDGEMFGRSMNIDMEYSGKSFLLVYTYDLFRNQTVHKIDFGKVEIVG